MKVELELLTNKQIYRRIVQQELRSVKRSLLIGTALVKETRLETDDGVTSFNAHLDKLVRRGVEVCVLFAGQPSRPFMKSLLEFPKVLAKVTWRICPRTHLKAVLVDGERLYLGSANLTGAGMGMKAENKRNFELGLFTTDQQMIRKVSTLTADIINGRFCDSCGVKKLCRQEHDKFEKAVQTGKQGACT